MPAERAGYTVTMFLVDVSPSMGLTRTVELPDGRKGEKRTSEMTNLEWSLQFVLLKIQEMIYAGRKTEQCGVILFGTEDTDNIINEKNGGYEHVSEYIPIGQPNANTLAKLHALRPSSISGDPIDAIIVGVETQDKYLGNKKTWTRKLVLITDGENPIEIEDWELTVNKMNSLNIRTTIIGIDFDDDEFGFHEEEKSVIKRENETFFAKFVEGLDNAILGTCAYALQECVRPDVKLTKSALLGNILRIGDVENREDEAIELSVKTSKCTAATRPPSMKKFAKRTVSKKDEDEDVSMEEAIKDEAKDIYAQLSMQTEYFVNRAEEGADIDAGAENAEGGEEKDGVLEKVDKEELIKGFKYGSSFVPCPEGSFARLETRKGIDICGFFPDTNLRRDYGLGEVSYVWADPASNEQQVAFSSIVKAMIQRAVVAIARWVTRDGMDPKMGLLVPRSFENVECFLWLQMPFADDVRKYTFPSLTKLVSKKGETLKHHPYLPTNEQLSAMEHLVDGKDLMHAGDKDESGERMPWFDPRLSYNPAVHRIKQALFHAATVTDLNLSPLPPPHPEVVKYLEPPKRVVKRAQAAVEECKSAFKVRQVPKRVLRPRKEGHVRAEDDDEDMLLLDKIAKPSQNAPTPSATFAASSSRQKDSDKMDQDGSETEPESDEEATLQSPKSRRSTRREKEQLPSPVQSDKEETEPGRIIGEAAPLKDFKNNIKKGDLVTKAVEDLGWAIKTIVTKPFASRRHTEMIECMTELRSVCLNEDEIDAWNAFLKELKEACLSTSGSHNKVFWSTVVSRGRTLGLISDKEAEEVGGKSNIPEREAAVWQ